jgi:ribosomal protein L37AE/L43A
MARKLISDLQVGEFISGFVHECPSCAARHIARKNAVFCSEACKQAWHRQSQIPQVTPEVAELLKRDPMLTYKEAQSALLVAGYDLRLQQVKNFVVSVERRGRSYAAPFSEFLEAAQNSVAHQSRRRDARGVADAPKPPPTPRSPPEPIGGHFVRVWGPNGRD